MTFPERVIYKPYAMKHFLQTSFTFSSDVHTKRLWSSATYHVYVPIPKHNVHAAVQGVSVEYNLRLSYFSLLLVFLC